MQGDKITDRNISIEIYEVKNSKDTLQLEYELNNFSDQIRDPKLFSRECVVELLQKLFDDFGEKKSGIVLN